MTGDDDAKKKRKRKGTISEDDVSVLLQRYNPTTILALLQEVCLSPGVKIDWKTLVKKTSTGITNAREYQMLWRHLAYRETLEKVNGTQPLGDDSDLEFEVEAIPPVNGEASAEAAACVRILISSGAQHESGPTNRSTVEAPLTINIPSDRTLPFQPDDQHAACCALGVNITVPVSVQKHSIQTGPLPDDEMPAKKKRKCWTKEEEMELIDAVQKHGEGNWAGILRDFKHDRTASQLSQRWALIRKRLAKNPGSGIKPTTLNWSEERMAAQKAVCMAIDMPMGARASAVISGAAQSSTPASAIRAPVPEAPLVTAQAQPQPQVQVQAQAQAQVQPQAQVQVQIQPQAQVQVQIQSQSHVQAQAQVQVQVQAHPKSQAVSNQVTCQMGASNHSNKPRTAPRKTAVPVTPSISPGSSIQAAAFAAGGRIAAPSAAASLYKAAQSKAAVHINAFPKSSGPGAKLSPGTNILAPMQNLGSQVLRSVLPPSSKTSTAALKPGSQQGQVFAGRQASSPAFVCGQVPKPSTQSETKTGIPAYSAPHEIEVVKFGSKLDIDVSNLLAEGDGDLDEMELDSEAAHGHRPSFRCLDVDENNTKANRVDTKAAENQDMVIDAGGTQLLPEKGTPLLKTVPSKSEVINGANAPKQDTAKAQLDGMEMSADKNKQTQDPLAEHNSDTASGSKPS